MIEPDMHRAQAMRQQIGRVLRGNPIQDGVSALEMVIVDVLTSLPGIDESNTLASFGAMASDVRELIVERFAAVRSAH